MNISEESWRNTCSTRVVLRYKRGISNAVELVLTCIGLEFHWKSVFILLQLVSRRRSRGFRYLGHTCIALLTFGLWNTHFCKELLQDLLAFRSPDSEFVSDLIIWERQRGIKRVHSASGTWNHKCSNVGEEKTCTHPWARYDPILPMSQSRACDELPQRMSTSTSSLKYNTSDLKWA